MSTVVKNKKFIRGLSSKFQVVIPVVFRERFNIKKNSLIVFEENKDNLVLKILNDPIKEAKGMLKKPVKKTALELVKEARKEELNLEK